MRESHPRPPERKVLDLRKVLLLLGLERRLEADALLMIEPFVNAR